METTKKCVTRMATQSKNLVLCFGNPLVEEDNLSLKVGRFLAQDKEISQLFSFIECVKPEDFFDEFHQQNVFILDVAADIKEIRYFKDLDALKDVKKYSAHGLDLTFYLKLYHTLGEINSINIIAIPTGGNMKKIAKDVAQILIANARV